MEEDEMQFKELTEEEIDLRFKYWIKADEAFEKKDSETALQYYDKALGIDPNNVILLKNRGIVLNLQEKYDLSIESLEKALVLIDRERRAINNSLKMNDEKEKIKLKSELSDLARDEVRLLYFLGLNYFDKKDILKSASYFIQTKTEILDILSLTSKELAIEILKQRGDEYFNKLVIESNKYLDSYIVIYLQSLEIVSSLWVKEEKQITHYTNKCVAELLISDNSPFRLNTITTANDPKEGKPILQYLDISEDYASDEYQAFVGCFIFNPDSLNQFRLYGKESGEEGTGTSLVFKPDYFSKRIGINTSMSGAEKWIDKDKEALFRCIYFDPKTEQVISVGHQDEYAFYRERYEGKIYKRTITEYNKYIDTIDKLVVDLRTYFNDLKKEVENLRSKAKNDAEIADMNKTVCGLLIHLRYLVKHVAFQEEQECRVIKVEALENNPKVQYGDGRMYVEYLPASAHITDIFFGPKARGVALFKDMLRMKGKSEVKTHQSDHPFF